MGIKVSSFGRSKQGKDTKLFTIINKNGMSMEVSDYGATIVSIVVPDKDKKMKDIALGYDDVSDYEQGTNFFGACIGRNGNRTGKGEMIIQGKVYQMEQNEKDNNLHSGSDGYHNIIWDAETVESENQIIFTHTGEDGEQGLPGKLEIKVTYMLTDEDEIQIHYEGTADKDTVFNVTNHSYFNLGGHDAGSIENHLLTLTADQFTAVDENMIPTGDLVDVAGTPMDFTETKAIGRDIGCDYKQLLIGGGYDHNFVLQNADGKIRKIAEVSHPENGRHMDVLTDCVGVQFYAGNFINGSVVGKNGERYEKRSGLALETQFWPDACHHDGFPSYVLKAGEKYDTTTIYRFYVQ